MKKQMTDRARIAWMIATPFIVFGGTLLITLTIVLAVFGSDFMSLAVFGMFSAPFIFLGVLLAEVVIYWIVMAIVGIVKAVKKHQRLALAE